ncbi:MAG TPA: hypothetical protein PK858_09225 [Saprospiraceae bacterium]|nr:hypothetical protein [Saprospiraceae bacterium]
MQGKSFFQRPEGVTGIIFLIGLMIGAGFLLNALLPMVPALVNNSIALGVGLGVLATLIFTILDPRARNLIWYAYQSLMRSITGVFVRIDPISILKSYVENLEKSLRNLSKQIGALRGQMRQLRGTMDGNLAEINKNMVLADQAKRKSDEKNMTIAARKAARLQEANAKYEVLFQKMEVLYRILSKMYENSEIVLEDTKDQVNMKQQEYEAIRSSHSAIQSAMSILKGDPDQRAMFDQALEALADDVSHKVGEMERFMDTSRNLMASIDIQNGVFADEGLRMLEEWEQKGPFLARPAAAPAPAEKPLDLNTPPKEVLKADNEYDRLFE